MPAAPSLILSQTLLMNYVARSMIPLGENQVGSGVVVAFECGDPREPIITGLLWQADSLPQAKTH